jgi:hypothetical protein
MKESSTAEEREKKKKKITFLQKIHAFILDWHISIRYEVSMEQKKH